MSGSLAEENDQSTQEPNFGQLGQELAGSLEGQMADFLELYRHFIDEELSWEEKEAAAEEIQEQRTYLSKAAKHYDEVAGEIQNGVGFVQTHETRAPMEQARELMGKEFLETMNQYYRELEELIVHIITKMKAYGLHYLLDRQKHSQQGYCERVADDLEQIFEKMATAKKYSNETLTPLSEDYASLQNIPAEQRSVELDAYLENRPKEKDNVLDDSAEYRKELAGINKIFDLIDKNASPEQIKEKMFRLTHDIFSHLEADLGRHALLILQKNSDAERNIDIYFKDKPLAQIEILLDLMIRSIRMLGNIYMQKNLLFGEEEIEDRLTGEQEAVNS